MSNFQLFPYVLLSAHCASEERHHEAFLLGLGEREQVPHATKRSQRQWQMALRLFGRMETAANINNAAILKCEKPAMEDYVAHNWVTPIASLRCGMRTIPGEGLRHIVTWGSRGSWWRQWQRPIQA